MMLTVQVASAPVLRSDGQNEASWIDSSEREFEMTTGCSEQSLPLLRRRTTVGLIAAACLTPVLRAYAQPSRVLRVGALYIGTADAESFKMELREGLRELGYVEGKNVVFEFRSADERLDRLPGLAAELVRLKVDVIVALYVPPSLAAKHATRDIPIVVLVGDPVETGIVPSLARPGGNITGVSLMAIASHAKSLELLRDMLPSARRIGVLAHSTNPVFANAMLQQIQLGGRKIDMSIEPVVMTRGPEDLDASFAALAKARPDAVIVQGSLAIKPVTNLALTYRLPSVSTARAFADIGGLMAFGADGPSTVRHGAKFVHRIFQGRHPKDLPIEQPTKFELTLNLRTAKAIGVTVPQSMVLRADVLLE